MKTWIITPAQQQFVHMFNRFCLFLKEMWSSLPSEQSMLSDQGRLHQRFLQKTFFWLIDHGVRQENNSSFRNLSAAPTKKRSVCYQQVRGWTSSEGRFRGNSITKVGVCDGRFKQKVLQINCCELKMWICGKCNFSSMQVLCTSRHAVFLEVRNWTNSEGRFHDILNFNKWRWLFQEMS